MLHKKDRFATDSNPKALKYLKNNLINYKWSLDVISSKTERRYRFYTATDFCMTLFAIPTLQQSNGRLQRFPWTTIPTLQQSNGRWEEVGMSRGFKKLTEKAND